GSIIHLSLPSVVSSSIDLKDTFELPAVLGSGIRPRHRLARSHANIVMICFVLYNVKLSIRNPGVAESESVCTRSRSHRDLARRATLRTPNSRGLVARYDCHYFFGSDCFYAKRFGET